MVRVAVFAADSEHHEAMKSARELRNLNPFLKGDF